MDTPIFHLEKVVNSKTEDMEDFTGPLDLILSLISKNKMEIENIQISTLLDQYLQWMSFRKRMDMDVASEFVTMAAQLVFIKTRMLLSLNDEEALSEMEQLIASLEEHQRHESFGRIKGVIPGLSDRFSIGRDYITKVPEAVPVNKVYRYAHQSEDLRRAMAAVLERVDHHLPPPMSAFDGIVGREPYPVGDKATEIVGRLVQFGVTRFRALFKGNRSRSEIVATFIAVLELCKAKRILLAGTESDCTVTCTDGAEDELEFSTDAY